MSQRKRALLHFASLTLLCLAASVVSAAEWGVHVSRWDTEDLGESDGGGLRVGFELLPQIDVELGVSYFPGVDEELELDLLDFNFELDVIPVDLGVKLDIGRPGRFYVAAGVSYYRLDADDFEVDEEFGYYGGVGLAFSRLFFEARYRNVEGTVDELSFDGVELADGFAVDLTGIELTVGVRF